MTTDPSPLHRRPRPASGLRLLRPRPCEPRYDDEVADPDAVTAVTEGALALSLVAGPGTGHDRRLRLVVPGDEPDEHVPPPARAWVARLVHALTEVLAGDRPLAQLAPHLSHEVYGGLDRSLQRRPVARPQRRPPALPAVRTLRLCEPRPGVAEVAAVVRRGERMRAIALRLEATEGRWRCTALQVG